MLPGINIGRGVTVGAGSVVTKDVPDFCCVAGNPARMIRQIEPKEPDPNQSATSDGEEVAVNAGLKV